MKIAVTRELPDRIERELSAFYKDVRVHDGKFAATREEIFALAPEADVLLCTIADRIDRELLDKMPNLKCLVTYSVGMDHIDIAEVLKRKIQLTHTPNVLTDATADLAFALILACVRRLKPAAHHVSTGQFKGFVPGGFLGRDLSQCSLGIVGMGRIGSGVARRGQGFGLKILESARGSAARFAGAKALALPDLLAEADIVSLNCPSNAQTRHLIGAKELKLMKKDAVLVNTARGDIIDEEALVQHLKATPEFVAGLDVYEREPLITPGLVELDNAVCLPHIGSATVDARMAMARCCIDEAIRFARGEKLHYRYEGP